MSILVSEIIDFDINDESFVQELDWVCVQRLNSRLGVTFFLFFFLIIDTVIAKDLVMTAPPREKAAAGKKLYEPLAAVMGDLLGVKVVYKAPGNWLRYQRNMRNGEYDIVFDGPHFASWRIEHLGHHAVAKLPGTLDFYLIAKKSDTKIIKPEDLIGKKICGISPPNLSTLSILARFDNPVRQPVILGIRGGMPKVLKKFYSGSCRAAVIRVGYFLKKIKKSQRDKLRILFSSNPLPNQVITVSNRITKSQRDRIARAIISGRASKAAKALVKRFGGKAKSFVSATTEEYYGPRVLLEGVIFGW